MLIYSASVVDIATMVRVTFFPMDFRPLLVLLWWPGRAEARNGENIPKLVFQSSAELAKFADANVFKTNEDVTRIWSSEHVMM